MQSGQPMPGQAARQAPDRARPVGLAVHDGRQCIGVIRQQGDNHIAFTTTGECIGTYPSRRAAVRAIRMTRLDLSKQASAFLGRAGFDPFTGAKRDKQYRRNKRAEDRIAGRRWRKRQKELGKFGAASPGRHIDPTMRSEKT
jgi:hypothetical protein